MYKKQKISILLTLVIAMQATMAFSCFKSSNPNDPKEAKIRILVRAEDDFAQGFKSTASIIAEAKKISAISQEDIEFLKPILEGIGNSHKQAIRLTKELLVFGDNIPMTEKEKLLAVVNFISDQLTLLNNEGVLRIKNETQRVLFNTVVLTLQSTVTSVIITLNLKG